MGTARDLWDRLTDSLLRPSPGASPDSSTGSASDEIGYAPELDGDPDPGEVVWGWVPYEDDPRQGKDRPVLIIGRSDDRWLGLYLSSQDHDRDAAQEAREGRYWMDIGSGGWDHSGRPSEVRLDRLLRLEDDAIRREGAVLDRGVFEAVLVEARRRGAIA